MFINLIYENLRTTEPSVASNRYMQKFLLPMIVDVHRWFKSHIQTNILVYQKSASSFIT